MWMGSREREIWERGCGVAVPPFLRFPLARVPILAEIERREVLEEARLLIELEFNQKGR